MSHMAPKERRLAIGLRRFLGMRLSADDAVEIASHDDWPELLQAV